MKIKTGPFPLALNLHAPTHLRLLVRPLDRPGPSCRDEIIVTIEQRTTGTGVSVTLDLGRVANVVRWLDSPEHFDRVLSLPDTGLAQRPGEAPSIDLLTLVRESDVELLAGIEHWTSGVRKHYEAQLVDGQIHELRDWLYRFWADGLPDVPRRRADESATEFAARRAQARSIPGVSP